MKRSPGRPDEPRSRPQADAEPTARPDAERATEDRVPHWWSDSEDNFCPGLYPDGKGGLTKEPPKRD